jgi:hypothetical protein
LTVPRHLERSWVVRDLKGMVGFVVDVLAVGRMRFRNPHALTKFLIIDSVRRQTRAHTFIEAGTCLGTTAGRCARVFRQVFTVELDRDLADRSIQFLRNRRNVSVIHADALQAIPRIIEENDLDRIVVFLDAHAPLGSPVNGRLLEPAIEELKLLTAYRPRICGIIVDDFRNFGAAAGFPPRSCLLRAAEDFCSNGDFEFAVHLDQLVVKRRTTS